ncbi:MAG: hypothetical protein ACFFE5_09855 [Candidatus Thorarchaeota archaeon]
MNEIIEQELILKEETETEEECIKKEKYVSTKKTLTGKYYEYLLRSEPILTLLIIGAILGGIFSFSFIYGSWDLWFWIPLTIVFIGPVGLVFLALILPFIPWILYIALRVFLEILANA